MRIPLSYIVGSLAARRLTTALTAGGMALVVYVFATVLMLSEGLEKTLQSTGSDANVIAIRRGAQTEVQSSVERSEAAIIETWPGIAVDAGGRALVSKEILVLLSLTKRGTDKPSNVTVRGLSPVGLAMRPQVGLLRGRMFRPGTSEIIAADKIANGFNDAGLGETLRFGMRDWTVVGVFDAGSTGFASELWGDGEQLMQAFRRTAYSAVVFTLADPKQLASAAMGLEKDPRLKVAAKRETEFYAEQSKQMVSFLTVLGMTLSVVFSIGAIIGALITMYGAVVSRTREIGTLRALGFQRRSILVAFLLEAVLLGVIGGIAGIALAAQMQFLSVSTLNWQTFAELAFGFTLTAGIIAKSMAFSLAMGLLGGVLPAARAARLEIVDALRAA